MSQNKRIYIIGGGTVFHISNHLALSAPAYGKTAWNIAKICELKVGAGAGPVNGRMDVVPIFSKMAGEYHERWYRYCGDEPKTFETHEQLQQIVDEIVQDPLAKIVFFNPAVVDFAGSSAAINGKYATRVKSSDYSRDNPLKLELEPLPKIIDTIRKERKDIFLVGFKTTTAAEERDQYLAALNMLKRSSCNLVLANDVVTRTNMIVTPEEAAYNSTTDRQEVLKALVDMALQRSHLTFTRSTVVHGESIPWTSDIVPSSLRKVVEHCIEQGAYQRFRGVTTGHFAFKVDDTTFVTSKRKTDFNNIHETGMVLIKTDGPDTILAYGAKPSVGGQSQRIVFSDHPGYDCIVHFHCALKPGSKVPVRSQREFECGSHQCGVNTSEGLMLVGDGIIKAVFLDKHGPNVVFNHEIDPQEVIEFIDANFDLRTKTGGYNVEER